MEPSDTVGYVYSFSWLNPVITPGYIGVPRETTADDVYKGMFIPKGATVIPNITYATLCAQGPTEVLTRLTRAMSLDDTVYSDPHVFRPERFLPPNPEPLPTDFFFGFGRRYVFF